MNIKKWIIASVVIFVLDQILSYIVHGVLLSGMYEATANLWRPMEEMNSMMWMNWLSGLLWVFIFVYIFAKGYEGKGKMEGLRFGLLIGVFFGVSMSVGMYATQPIPGSLAFSWFVSSVVLTALYGYLAALLYIPKAAVKS